MSQRHQIVGEWVPGSQLDFLYFTNGSRYNRADMDARRSSYEFARESTAIIVHASARMILCLILLELGVVMLGVGYLCFELIYTILIKTIRLL